MKASLNLQDPIYNDEDAARAHLEAIRWPRGPTCPHCGSARGIRLQGKSTRPGLLNCRDCRKQFSITVGTVFEGSHVPLNKWVAAADLLCGSNGSMSALALHRTLGVTYRTAGFMARRIREAMKDPHWSRLTTGSRPVSEPRSARPPMRVGQGLDEVGEAPARAS